MMSSFGQGVANANAANASANMANQQAQGEQLKNQLAKARLPIVLKALADYGGHSDDTGDTESMPGKGTANGNGIQATPGTDGNTVPNDPNNPDAGQNVPNQPAVDVNPQNWYDPARVDQGLRQRYFINPAGTPQEMKNIMGAGLSGDPGLLEAAKQQRELGVQGRLAQTQSEASQLYETMTNGVVNAPDGRALDALEAISPQAATQIRKLIPDEVDEDEAARAFATHVANTVHQYSGRKVVADSAGVWRDEVTGNPLAGAPKTGMSAEQLAQLAKDGNQLVPIKRSDGSEVMTPRYLAEGSKTLHGWLTKIADQKGNVQGASPTVTGVPRAQWNNTVKEALSKVPPPPPPQAPQAPGAPPPGSPAAGALALQSKILPDPSTGKPLNIDSLPPANLPPPVTGRTASPEEQASIDAFKENYKQVQTDAMRKLQETNQADALLTPFQQKLATVNPRDVGPGSETYKKFLDFKAAVMGKPPNDLVDMGVLDKFANQLGVQNVRQLLSGQRITNQEMMNFLTRASASTTQPLDVMRTIVSYQRANNDFDRKWATTALTALAKHKDPAAVQGLESFRTQFVDQQMTRDGFGGGGGVQKPPPKPMPDGPKLAEYARVHFGGNVAAATAHLKTQGYQ